MSSPGRRPPWPTSRPSLRRRTCWWTGGLDPDWQSDLENDHLRNKALWRSLKLTCSVESNQEDVLDVLGDGYAHEGQADHGVGDGVLVELDGVDPLVDQPEDISHGAGTQAVNNVQCTPLGTAHDTDIDIGQSPSKRRRLAHCDGDGDRVEEHGADGGVMSNPLLMVTK